MDTKVKYEYNPEDDGKLSTHFTHKRRDYNDPLLKE